MKQHFTSLMMRTSPHPKQWVIIEACMLIRMCLFHTGNRHMKRKCKKSFQTHDLSRKGNKDDANPAAQEKTYITTNKKGGAEHRYNHHIFPK